MGLFSKKRPTGSSTRREMAAERRLSHQEADSGAYQRSRTLSSRRSSSSDNVELSERQATWNLRKKRRKLLAWLGGLLGAAGIILLLLWQLVVSVEVQTPDARDSASHDKYATILDEYYGTRPLERLRFVLDEQTLNGFMIERASEVQSVRIVGGGQLGVGALQVSFRQPVVRWSAAGADYFVDATGVTFEKNYFSDPGIAVTDNSGVPPEAGQEVVNRRFLSFLGQSVALFHRSELQVTEVILPPDTVRQVEFRAEGLPYAIRMTVDREASVQVEQAIHTKRFIDQRGIAPEYIDVRVDQRVYYR